MLPPESVRKDRNRFGVLAVDCVRRQEPASEDRRNAQVLETIRGKAHGVDVLWKILPRQDQRLVIDRQNVFDNGRLPKGLNFRAIVIILLDIE